jgi:hypothetical protein
VATARPLGVNAGTRQSMLYLGGSLRTSDASHCKEFGAHIANSQRANSDFGCLELRDLFRNLFNFRRDANTMRSRFSFGA